MPATGEDERYVLADGRPVALSAKAALPLDQLRKQIQDAAGRAGRPVAQ